MSVFCVWEWQVLFPSPFDPQFWSMILIHDGPNTAVQRFLSSSCSKGNSGHLIPCHRNIFYRIQWARDHEKKELSPENADFSSAETSLMFSATVVS